jgi:hypothetical protein
MVTAGGFGGNTVADGGEYVYFNWQLQSQNAGGNYSVITWQVGWAFVTYSCRGLRQGSASIEGSTVYYDYDGGDGVHAYNGGHDHRPALETVSGTAVVYHNSDGGKIFSAAAQMTGFSAQTSSGSSSWELPAIPRLSSPPSTPILSSITATSVFVEFTDGSGGAEIDGREIGYGVNSDTPQYTTSSDGSTAVTDLTPGTVWYFWARTHNVSGYSDWSPRAMATTLGTPEAPSIPIIEEIGSRLIVVSWEANGDNGSPISGFQVGYGTDPDTPSSIVSGVSPKDITGLTPATKYYFRVRAINAVGAGPWSDASNATTIAGSRIKVSGEYKMAIPYVKYAGVWQIARPYGKLLGEWKETI